MENLQTVYRNLTSVNIEEQKRLWDERGKGYYGEYLLFTELYQRVQGQSKILMNLNVPTENGRTTEIDILMIHESGLYVFEAKHYKGTIYGRYEDRSWTQYFRTQKNSHFPSPIKQNEYHIAALKRMFPGIPTHSFVVFTNEDTGVKVSEWEDTGIVVCKINQMAWYIDQINRTSENRLTGEQIDSVFNTLSAYAPMNHETVFVEGEVLPLSEYVNQFKADYESAVFESKRAENRSYKRKLGIVITATLIICALSIIGAVYYSGVSQKTTREAQAAQQKAERELEEFAKKFRQVEPMNGGAVELQDGFLSVNDVKLKESADLKDTILFSCKIQVNSEQYGVRIHRNTSIVVQLKDGSVSEYVLSSLSGVFSDKYLTASMPRAYYDNTELPQIQIYTKSISDIEYIKLTNVAIFNRENMQKDLLSGTEFKLYAAD